MSSRSQELGRIIAERRKAMGFNSQEKLSEATGVLRKRISEIETGRYTGRITDLYRVLSALGMELDLRIVSSPTLDDVESLFPPEDD